MWPNTPSHLLNKYLMENFIFCAVYIKVSFRKRHPDIIKYLLKKYVKEVHRRSHKIQTEKMISINVKLWCFQKLLIISLIQFAIIQVFGIQNIIWINNLYGKVFQLTTLFFQKNSLLLKIKVFIVLLNFLDIASIASINQKWRYELS